MNQIDPNTKNSVGVAEKKVSRRSSAILTGACIASAILLPITADVRLALLIAAIFAWPLGFFIEGKSTRKKTLQVIFANIVAHIVMIAFAVALVWVLIKIGVKR